MDRDMRRLLIAFVFVALPLAAALTHAQVPFTGTLTPRTSASASGLELSALNRSVDACTDFYQYACGGWLASNPIPADRPRWGRFDELQERNYDVLRRILESAATGRDAATKKIGDYYSSCMDETTINRRGLSPLDADLKNIAALTSVSRLPELLAELHKIGVFAFFEFGAEADFKDASTVMAIVDQGGLGLPDRDYYLREDTRSAEIRTKYVDHVGKILALSGLPPAQAATAAATVLRLETSLARAALDVVSRRNPELIYHKMTERDLQALTPRFEWARYLRGIAAPPIAGVNVTEPDFFKAFDRVLGATPIDDLKTYLRWQVAHANAFILSTPFVDEHFNFYNRTLQGVQEQRPRWKRCVQYVDNDLGEALGQAFVREAFGPQAKADMLKMVHEIESALEHDITTLDWMTEATKKRALEKLHAISDKIGYPDRWRDYTALTVERGDAAGNSHRANTFEFHRQLGKIGKPLDKSEWSMTPPTVNAYYNPLENNINFPAGILQPPFYGASADRGVNFGGAGAVIGHELTHGFDDQGRQFDAQGNLKDWWTADDAKAFNDRTSCVVDQYAGYTAVDDVKLNGKLTLGENTADNGGLRVALMAYVASLAGGESKTLDGFTPEQRVFLGWAQVWCENRRPEYERLQAQTNPHSPGRYRVNGVVSNMPEFQKAFSCKAGAPMVRQNACRVW
jgi:putative endopeptidase